MSNWREEANGSGNNMPWTVDPPTYNHRYGYNDGAQEDIFIAAPPEPSSSITTARPSSMTSVSDSSTALPTTSMPSNGGRGLGVGYRIPRTYTSVLNRSSLTSSTFINNGCALRSPRMMISLEYLRR